MAGPLSKDGSRRLSFGAASAVLRQMSGSVSVAILELCSLPGET